MVGQGPDDVGIRRRRMMGVMRGMMRMVRVVGSEVAELAVREEGRKTILVLRVVGVERVQGTGGGQRTVVGIVVAHRRRRVVRTI